MCVEGNAGDVYKLQRSTNILDADGWVDVVITTTTDEAACLIDTNPISRAVFYRVRQILSPPP
jgi:hypothetical protein